MKVVVTGASGNIGTALLRTLAGEGWELVGVARRQPDTSVAPYSAARWVTGDLGTTRTLPEVFAGAAAVVHLAWAIHPRATEPPMARTNLVGTANVLAAVAEAGVPHLVAASSVAAYSPAGRWRRVTEDWPRGGVPGSAYSAGKAALETMIERFEARHPGVRVARIRPCGVAQRDAAALLASWLFSPLLPRRLLGRRWVPVPLWRDLRLQLVHSEDVARAVQLILAERAGGAYNLAAEPVLRAEDVAEAAGGALVPLPLAALSGAAWLAWRLGLQPLHPGWLRLADRAPLVDSGLARRELGWLPAHDTASTLTELVGGMRDGHRGASAPLCPPRSVRLGRPTHQSQRT